MDFEGARGDFDAVAADGAVQSSGRRCMGDGFAVVQGELLALHGFDIGLGIEQGPFDRSIGPGGQGRGRGRQALTGAVEELNLVGRAQCAPGKGHACGQGPVPAADAGRFADVNL